MLTQLKDPLMQNKKFQTMPLKNKTTKTVNALNLIDIDVQFSEELGAEEINLFKSVFKKTHLQSWVNWALDPGDAHLK